MDCHKAREMMRGYCMAGRKKAIELIYINVLT